MYDNDDKLTYRYLYYTVCYYTYLIKSSFPSYINDDYDDDKASFIVIEAIDDINNKHTIQKTIEGDELNA